MHTLSPLLTGALMGTLITALSFSPFPFTWFTGLYLFLGCAFIYTDWYNASVLDI